MVDSMTCRIHPGDGTEALNWPALLNAQGPTRRIRKGLVVITQDGQTQAMVPVIREFKNGVLGQLLLDTEEPTLNVWPARVGRNVADVRVHLIEAQRTRKRWTEPSLARDESRVPLAVAEQWTLIHGRDVHLGPVYPKFVGAAQSIQVDIADAITSSHNGLAVRRIGEAEARAEVLVIRFDQGSVVKASVRRLQQTHPRRVEVR